MARRGRFGRLPRQAPNLASTIVALAREMQNLRDQNIRNAWEKGGEFEGKQVTDEMIVQWWKDRRDSYDPNDPYWDYYNNLVDNYEFSIEESKMTLAYAQHRVGESAMASFYTKWAKRLPADSEAYRNLMRSAAQYLDVARSRGRGSAAAAKQAAYNAAVLASYNRYEKGYDTSSVWLAAAAVEAGVITEDQYRQILKGNTNLPEVLSVSEYDQSALMHVFDLIQTDPRYANYKKGLNDAMKGVPGWDGTLTYDDWIKMGDSKITGLRSRGSLAHQFGDKKGEADASEAVQIMVRYQYENKDIDPLSAYVDNRVSVDAFMSDPNRSPYEIEAFAAEQVKTLTAILARTSNPATRASLRAEIDAWMGIGGDTTKAKTFSVMEEATGATTRAVDVGGGDIATTLQTVKQAKQDVENLNSGLYIYVGNPNASNKGAPKWILVPVSSIDPNKGITTFETIGGHTVPVFTQWTPVYAQGANTYDARTGQPTGENKMTPGVSPLVGQVARLPDGSMVYGVYTGTKDNPAGMTYYTEPPWASGTNFSMSPDGSKAYVTYLADNPGQVVNPTAVLHPTATDTELMRSDRFDDPFVAISVGTGPGRWNLLNMNERDADNFYDKSLAGQNVTWTNPATGVAEVVPAATVAKSQLRDARVFAAAVVNDPRLLMRNAAYAVGEQFWDDYEMGKYARRGDLGRLLAETPAAQYAAQVMSSAGDITGTTRTGTGFSLGGIPNLPEGPKPGQEIVQPSAAHQKAMDLLNRSNRPIYENQKAEVAKAPVLQLPGLVGQYTGTVPNWFILPEAQGQEDRARPGYRPGYTGTLPPAPPAAPPPQPKPAPAPVAPPPPPPVTPPVTTPVQPVVTPNVPAPPKGNQNPIRL